MLSGRKAPQRCFPKHPFRTRLEPSCLAASQQELVEAHECLLGHFGIVRLVSFRINQSYFSNPYFIASQPALGPLRHPKKGAARTCYPSEGKIRGSDSGTQRLNKCSAPRLWILWIAL